MTTDRKQSLKHEYLYDGGPCVSSCAACAEDTLPPHLAPYADTDMQSSPVPEEVLGDSRPWTPGPWKGTGWGGVIWPDAPKRPQHVQNPDTNKMEAVKYKDEPRTYGYGCGNDFVACLNDGEYREYTDRSEQNANEALIALAPEMAEVLIDARNYLAGFGNCHGGLEQRIIAMGDRLLEIGAPNV